MANLDTVKIATFVRITRTEEAYAVRKLMQHEGDLSAALDAHYRFADTNIANRYIPDSEDNTSGDDLSSIDSEEETEEGHYVAHQSSVDEDNESRDVPAASLIDASALLDEWLALYEAAMIAGTHRTPSPDSSRYQSGSLTPRTPSPLAEAQRLIRKKQDKMYYESSLALREAEACELEIQAARNAERRKIEEEQELERQLAEKEASLPLEPAKDEENVVTILTRMPDGNRLTRCFMKSDNLQTLFDFIDITRLIKPDTYRLVKPFPKETFGAEESCLTLQELGLINKQEALFLEMV